MANRHPGGLHTLQDDLDVYSYSALHHRKDVAIFDEHEEGGGHGEQDGPFQV